MKRICISRDWLLSAPGIEGKKRVHLPNDYTITLPRDPEAAGGASNAYVPGGDGIYEKTLTPTSAAHRILWIDGAYMRAEIAVNGGESTCHPHGYTPFLYDLTDSLRIGEENTLTITTHGDQCSTRWYSGAGIYRDVYLSEGGDIRIEPWNLWVKTPDLTTAEVWCTITADRPAQGPVQISMEIVDADGHVVSMKELSMPIAAGESVVRERFTLENARAWCPEDPYLYTVRTTLREQGIVTDEDETRFGIRTVEADAEHGLRLNGQSLKLRGGCIHHDHGVLGAADHAAACRRKLTKLKEAGFSAVRIAHNPPSEQLMEMCDEMGILVMDEAFDCWHVHKGGDFNYHRYFDAWWEWDIEYMVRRDRRHPSVIAFSTGNEIPESKGTPEGDALSRKLADTIREFDDTRLVTSCTWQMRGEGDWGDRTEKYFEPLDICGYNYAYLRYGEDHVRFPKRVIWGSETHTVHFYDSWQAVLANPHVIGDFTWTAYDNLGEAGTGRYAWARDEVIHGISLAPYPWRSCYQGDLDLCGYRRPQSYFREAVWLGNCPPRIFTTHPQHYGEGFSGTGWHWYDVLDTWTFGEEWIGKPVKCEVYTDAEEIEWVRNGESLGRSTPVKAIATMDIAYAPGTLTAVSYKNGVEVGRSSLHTVGAPAKIVLTPEWDCFQADGRDLVYVDITVTDGNGERIPDSRAVLSCTVEGGELMGIFSGDPANEDQYGSVTCHAYEGRAVAIVRAENAGAVRITVSAEGLSSGITTVTAQ